MSNANTYMFNFSFARTKMFIYVCLHMYKYTHKKTQIHTHLCMRKWEIIRPCIWVWRRASSLYKIWKKLFINCFNATLIEWIYMCRIYNIIGIKIILSLIHKPIKHFWCYQIWSETRCESSFWVRQQMYWCTWKTWTFEKEKRIYIENEKKNK
jgi:hypothetical protein